MKNIDIEFESLRKQNQSDILLLLTTEKNIFTYFANFKFLFGFFVCVRETFNSLPFGSRFAKQKIKTKTQNLQNMRRYSFSLLVIILYKTNENVNCIFATVRVTSRCLEHNGQFVGARMAYAWSLQFLVDYNYCSCLQ